MARSLSVSVAVLVAAVAAVALSSVAEARPAGRRSTRWGYTGAYSECAAVFRARAARFVLSVVG